MSALHAHGDMLPKGTLVIVGALLSFAVGSVALVRIAGVPPSASPEATRAAEGTTPVASRNLRFTDRVDGAVVIVDIDRGNTASVIEPGQQTGFIRGVMRGLARERKMRGLGDAAPFTLTEWRDGQLSLTDTATGRSVELTAFGADNRAAFAALLPRETR